MTEVTAARHKLAEVARGGAPADLVLSGARVLEVHTGQLIGANVAIVGERIARVGDVSDIIGRETEVVDLDGQVLLPGFVEAHMHMGSAHLAPIEFARLTVAHGTAAVGVDLKEPALVGGLAALLEWLEELRHAPLRVLLSGFPPLLMSPQFGERAAQALLDIPELVELREWSANAELANPRFASWAEAAWERGLMLAGHLEGERGGALQASAAIGVSSDHEAVSADEAIERAQLGLRVIARRGPDFASLMSAVTERGVDPRCFMFCVDDQAANELAEIGHIDGMIREAIAVGIEPLAAVRMASLTAAEHLGIAGDLGSLTPGKIAHVNVVADLADPHVATVIARGRVVARDGRYLDLIAVPPRSQSARESVRLGPVDASDLRIAAPRPSVVARVIALRDGSLATDAIQVELAAPDGELVADPAADLVKIAVLDRVAGTGALGLGLLRGLGLKRGAFASSFSFRDMNLLLVGVDDADMAAAGNRVRELAGGIVVVHDGEILAELPMPLYGVASELPYMDVAARLDAIDLAIRDVLGSPLVQPLARAAVPTFPPALPGLRLSIRGLEHGIPGRPPEVVSVVMTTDD